MPVLISFVGYTFRKQRALRKTDKMLWVCIVRQKGVGAVLQVWFGEVTFHLFCRISFGSSLVFS
jgi:hypothetical protein